MRPVRIEVEGFSAYRNRVEVDLEDVEFFALSGPTGAGKSSLVDAMIFALYGRVPRLGARAVAPVITAGADRARVAFEFEVDGEGYIASRLAERTDTGASVKEARLERADGTPMASGAGEVTAAVEDLLRLRFDDFTKTVVLPQGEFARFLNAGSRERRDLLRDLLGLELYTHMRELANVRRSVAAERLNSATSQLDSLDVPDADTLEGEEARVGRLEALSIEIEEGMARLEEGQNSLQTSRGALETANDAIGRLESIRAPEHLEEMEERLIAARDAHEMAEEALQEKGDEIEQMEERLSELPSEETITRLRASHEELEMLDERISELDVEAIESLVKQRNSDLEDAQNDLDAANERVTSIRLTHAAHAVAATLEMGEPCPVCHQVVSERPDRKTPEELSSVEETARKAEERVTLARGELDSARAQLTEATTRRSAMADQRQKLATSIADSLSRSELDDAERTRSELTASITTAKGEREQLERALRQAGKNLEDASEAVRTVSRALMVAREHIADLKPPHSESDDPTVQWKDLLSWRDKRLEQVVEDRSDLESRVERLEAEVNRINKTIVEEMTDAGVSAEPPFAVKVARELEGARHRVERMRETIKRASSLEEQLSKATQEEAVAGALASHLNANAFERWLMAGAIAGLVAGANELLTQLSGGGYSLEADEDGSFRIIDHRNADELRDVATLSGGETFLVSLALSLSLAETLSGARGGGLDAIILDEGFGTLDEESLDVVAAVLEELAGRGLMVGVITHVKELAARAPVRYQVTREPEGSRVEVMT
jgi:exonuclease SbcC